MRFIRNLSNKEKIMVSFLVMLVLLNGLTILISKNLGNVSYSFKSVLEDRLIVSKDLADIIEEIYKNRIFLLEDLDSIQRSQELIRNIQNSNTHIDQIALKVSKTYLTSEEADALMQLNEQVKDYRFHEYKIISLIEQDSLEAARTVYLEQSLPAFERILSTLHKLENIQVAVGENLYHQAQHTVNIIQITAYFSIGIALMITIGLLKLLRFKVK